MAWQPLSAQTLLLNDNFSDSERVTQGLPSSAYWYVSTSGQTSVSSGGLSTTTNAGQNFFANFTSGTGSAQTLNVGDSLTLAFTFSVTGAIDSSAGGFINGFRVGLLNSNGAAFTDSAGIFNSGFNAFTGYFAALNLKTSSVLDNPPIGLIKRSATDASVPYPSSPATAGTSFLILNDAFSNLGGNGTSSNPYDTLGLGGTVSTANQLIDGTTYTGALVFLRTGSTSMAVTLALGGGALSGYAFAAADTSSIFSAFNTVAIGPTSGDVTTFTLQDATVIYTAVPEPSTYAVMVGVFALIKAAFFRRRVAMR